jgi:hypothetical protein
VPSGKFFARGVDLAFSKIGGKRFVGFPPEICIEILFRSNSAAEIAEKRLLYFDAGAGEVWI